MTEFEFRVVVAVPLEDYDQVEERLLEAGIDDGFLGAEDEVVFVDFARSAATPTGAMLSAIRDLRACGIAAKRVDVDDLVTAAEIARRCGRSRESIRLLIAGERGPGGFPAPLSKHLRSRRWRWSEVVPWLETAGIIDSGHAEDAEAIAAVNGALELVRNTANAEAGLEIVRALQAS